MKWFIIAGAIVAVWWCTRPSASAVPTSMFAPPQPPTSWDELHNKPLTPEELQLWREGRLPIQ